MVKERTQQLKQLLTKLRKSEEQRKVDLATFGEIFIYLSPKKT
jgi:hypothetical protein